MSLSWSATDLERRRRLARLLIEKSYREGDFTLTSGRKSDYYFDCKQTALHPEGALLIGQLLVSALAQGPEVQAVAGPTLGADPIVAAVAVVSQLQNSPLPALIVRKQSKGHGTNQFLEGLGNVAPGAGVAVIEDVVTTGGSLLKAIGHVQDAGLKVAAVHCVLDRREGGTEALDEAGFALQALFTRPELLEAAG